MGTTGSVRAVLGTAIIVLLLVVWTNGGWSQGSVQAPPDPANVVVIVLDDIGVDQVNCYWANYPGPEMIPIGWEVVAPRTPNIDALAAAGTRFTNAWSSPVCSPTRAQIMTGKRPGQTGIGAAFNRGSTNSPGLPTTETGLGIFAPSAAVGKWHLAGLSQQNSHPCDMGFDSFLGTFYNLNGVGDACSGDPDPFMCWNRFDCAGPSPDNPQLVYATAQTTDDAVTKMNELNNAGGPWLLYVAYHASHAPYHCPPEDLYGSETGWLDSCSEDTTNGYHDDAVYQTRAMTQAMDLEIGQLLDALDVLGGAAADGNYGNTAVILISDNGTPSPATIAPFPGNHAKATVYQGGINVPLIIRAPGPPMPQVSNELVSATDVFATTVHFLKSDGYEAHLNIPGLDSRSVASLVDAEYDASDPRTFVYSELFTPNFNRLSNGDLPVSFHATLHHRAVRNARYKLIDVTDWMGQMLHPGGRREFYRLYDPALEGQYPVPQDPAILDPFGNGFGSLHSPFEDTNLLTIAREEWPADAEQAFADLSAQLDSVYPPLPTGSLSPSIGRSTNGTVCDDDMSGVYVRSQGGVASRAFLEFPIPASIQEVYSAHLFVAAVEGGSDPLRTVKLWPVAGDVSDYTGDCPGLFLAITGTPYNEVDGWTGTSFGKVIRLGAGAADSILAASGDDNKFSVGITLGDESQDYSIHLQKAWGNPVTNGQYKHYLILRYTTSTGQQMVDAIPAPPARENKLSQSYPNPFNPTATIAYAVKEPSLVSLRVYDVSGALVRTLVDRTQPAGDDYKVVWDGRNDAGLPVSSGVYFYRLAIGDFVESKKMVMLK